MNRKIICAIIVLALVLAAEAIFIWNAGSGQPGGPDAVRIKEEVQAGDSIDTVMPGTGIYDTDWQDVSGDGGSDDTAGTGTGGVDEIGPDKSGRDKSGSGINSDDESDAGDPISLINKEGTTAAERILPPEGFERIGLDEGSFGEYLRDLPLKPHGSPVKYYDGGTKPWDVHVAVVDMDVSSRDLQQCADAVIRLRAEYLYKNGRYDQIHFNFTNGFNAQYSKWIQGYRISIKGNDAVWTEGGSKGTDYESFRKYLDMVFSYAGTLSLSKEMKRIDLKDLQPGDVFLRGGSPGHCVIVTDMAENPVTGERVFLAAQSYMPAQDIHILKNPANEDDNPWYPVKFGEELVTPEWTFSKDQIYRFAD
jgi:hypothetical protein